jgi:hypothetical protein
MVVIAASGTVALVAVVLPPLFGLLLALLLPLLLILLLLLLLVKLLLVFGSGRPRSS